MEKETTIDLAKFEEAQATIDSIQEQFCRMVMDKIAEKSSFECKFYDSSSGYDKYFSTITVSGISAILYFYVPMCSSFPVQLTSFRIDCSKVDLLDEIIETKDTLTIKPIDSSRRNMLLQYEAPGN